MVKSNDNKGNGGLKAAEGLRDVIPRIFDECQRSTTCHKRNVSQLVACRRESGAKFWIQFKRYLTFILEVQKREKSVQNLLKFIVSFATWFDEDDEDAAKEFVENLLRFLLHCSKSPEKWTRIYANFVISEVISNLSESLELSFAILDQVQECMLNRLWDKLPQVRQCAVSSLSRLIDCSEEDDMSANPIVKGYKKLLQVEKRPDVRKFIVSCLPLCEAVFKDIVERTLDFDRSVRLVSFTVLKELPIMSLSISQRSTVLQRGLSDRDSKVWAECKDLLLLWLDRDCEKDIIGLLKCLDVETHEASAETVLSCLFEEQIDFQSFIRELKKQDRGLFRGHHGNIENRDLTLECLRPEEAILLQHYCDYLSERAEKMSKTAATSLGAEADVAAASAEEIRSELDRYLPETVEDFVTLVKDHFLAGPDFMFSARRLLGLSQSLDFVDSSGRKAAALFVEYMFCAKSKAVTDSTEEESMHESSQIELVLNLAGDKKWKAAATKFVLKVFAAEEQFVEAMSVIVAALLEECRENKESPLAFLKCLVSVELLLCNIQSLQKLTGSSVEPNEVLHWLLIPGLSHENVGVRRLSLHCLGLYSILDLSAARENLSRILEALSDVEQVRSMAATTLFDLILLHGHENLLADTITGELAENQDETVEATVMPDISSLLKALAKFLDVDDSLEDEQVDEEVVAEECSTKEIVAEGFAKLLRKRVQPEFVLRSLLEVYFSPSSENFSRVEQCLSVFFDHYCRLPQGKEAVSAIFTDLVRDSWPGLNSPSGKAPLAARQWATKLSQFMLAMLLAPPVDEGSKTKPDLTFQESLALKVAAEILRFKSQKSSAVTGYVALLCSTLTCLDHEGFSQSGKSRMRYVLPRVAECVSADAKAMKDLKSLSEYLDQLPELELSTNDMESLREVLGEENVDFPAASA